MQFVNQDILLWDDCNKMHPSRAIYVVGAAGYLVTQGCERWCLFKINVCLLHKMYISANRILGETCMVTLKNEQTFSELSSVLGTHFTTSVFLLLCFFFHSTEVKVVLVLPIYIWGIAEKINKPKVSHNLSYSSETEKKEKVILSHFKKFGVLWCWC